jgi:hypothetical protein
MPTETGITVEYTSESTVSPGDRTDAQMVGSVACPHCDGNGWLPRMQRAFRAYRGGYGGQLVTRDSVTMTPAMAETLDLVRAGKSTPAEVAAERNVRADSVRRQLSMLIDDGFVWTPSSGRYLPTTGQPSGTPEVSTDGQA